MGADKFHAGVSVECDFTAGEQSEESFDPTHSVMASSEKTEDAVTTATAGGVPGAASNLPRPTSRPGSGSGGTTRRTENVIYQTSRTTRHIKLPQGSVKRLSISILLDQDAHWEGQGRGCAPRAGSAVAGAVEIDQGTGDGRDRFQADRGDQIVVETQPFESTLNLEPPAAAGRLRARPAPEQRLPGWLGKIPIDQKLLAAGGGRRRGAGPVADCRHRNVWCAGRRSGARWRRRPRCPRGQSEPKAIGDWRAFGQFTNGSEDRGAGEPAAPAGSRGPERTEIAAGGDQEGGGARPSICATTSRRIPAWLPRFCSAGCVRASNDPERQDG